MDDVFSNPSFDAADYINEYLKLEESPPNPSNSSKLQQLTLNLANSAETTNVLIAQTMSELTTLTIPRAHSDISRTKANISIIVQEQQSLVRKQDAIDQIKREQTTTTPAKKVVYNSTVEKIQKSHHLVENLTKASHILDAAAKFDNLTRSMSKQLQDADLASLVNSLSDLKAASQDPLLSNMPNQNLRAQTVEDLKVSERSAERGAFFMKARAKE